MTPQSDEDEVWRQIVASFNETAERDSADQPWPDSENVPEEPTRRVVRPPEFREVDTDLAEPEGETEPVREEEEEGHYVPPPPPPLPKLDLPTKLAWVALFGGPAYLLLAAMAEWEMEGWALFTAVGARKGRVGGRGGRVGGGPPPPPGGGGGAGRGGPP
ncbi:hypothetical protein, partial [Nonomuraea sp. NPDC059022]|uniref:hypothetical protein n=1 Tax=Nonomuraea sp. NPDC059022 TaxID=3346705 RepID=UPI0036874955